jgi:Holliday junction resolvasome RuvABC DNA-binding subunit
MTDLPILNLHTSSEKLADAQVKVLKRIEAQLARIATSLEQSDKSNDSGEVILSEGQAQVESLPPDIPGREALTEAGYTSVNQLPTSGKDLEKIKGIGKVTANQILTYLKTK